MKKNIEDIAKEKIADLKEKKISRKEAIKKSGYLAVSAATMMILLGKPNNAQAQAQGSPAAPPPW